MLSARLSEGLRAAGWVTEVGAIFSSTDGAGSLSGIPVSRAGRLARAAVGGVSAAIESFRPDVVLATGGATLRYSVLGSRRHTAALAYVAIGEPRYWIRSPAARSANRYLLRRVDRVFAVCSATRDQLLELEPALAGKVEVTYTGVPDRFFDLARPEPAPPLKVVVVGSLSTEKDPLLALEAVSLTPHALVRFVGDGPLRPDVEAAARRLGMSERAELAGVVDDVGPHLEWADLILLTSRTEGLPGVLLEAGAAGIPTVAVPVGGVDEAVDDGETGILVPPRAADIAEALQGLAADPGRRQAMGRAARDLIGARFRMDHVVATYARLLGEMLR